MEKDQMQSISIAELLTYEKLPVDIYIFADDRYLLIWKAGSPSVHLNKLTAKGVINVSMRLHDHAQLVQQAIKSGSSDSAVNRLTGLHKAVEKVQCEIELLGFNEEVFDHAKQINQVTLSFLGKNPRLIEILAKIGELQENEAKHLMTVSMFSTMLGLGHGWSKPSTIEKLALIGYLHDIGKTKIPKDILAKQLDRMSGNERMIYESHGEVGSQLLSQARSVPDDVLLAVHEHHELADGSGFPQRIKDLHISPFARVVSLADFLVEQLESIEGPDGKAKLGIVVEKVMARPRLFNKDVILAFQKIAPASLFKSAG